MPTPKPQFGKVFQFAFFTLLAITLSIISCKKFDQSAKERSMDQKEIKFFSNHASTDPLIKSVLQFVKHENEKYHFVGNLIKKIGYPYWDKSIVIRRDGSNGRRFSDSVNTVFIPFALDSGNIVNTTLIVRTSPSDTNFHFVADWQYAHRPYGAPTADSTAENMALLFMLEDKNVFGYNRFTITDPSLFGTFPDSSGSDGREIRFSSSNSRTALEYEVEVCFNSYVCPWPDWCSQHGGCDYMNCISAINPCHLIVSVCWTYIYDDDDGWSTGGYGGPEGGGTGGSGAGWNSWDPPHCEEPTGRSTIYEECGPGWTPPGIIVPIEAGPCDPTDRYSGATATAQYTILESTVQQFAAFDPNVTNQNEQYFVVNTVNGSNVPGTIQTLPTTGGAMSGITSNTVMVIHTHPYGGYPFPSAADFFGLATFNSNFQMNYVIAYDGTKYAMVINNYSQLQAFVANNPGAISSSGGFDPTSTIGAQSNTMRNILVAQGYSQDEAYERTLAFLMKQAGVTLVKAVSGSNVFKKIGLQQHLNADNSPAVNANGDPIYENADCL